MTDCSWYLRTSASPSPLAFLVSFFSIESISNHHIYIRHIYLLSIYVHTQTHIQNYRFHKKDEFCVLFTGGSPVPRAVVEISTNICCQEEGKKGRREEARGVKGREGENRWRKTRESCRFLAWSLSGLDTWQHFHNSFTFYKLYFLDFSSFECVSFPCNQMNPDNCRCEEGS